MRTWGIVFCLTAAGAVVLGRTATVLAFFLIGIVTTAAALAVLFDYIETRKSIDRVIRPTVRGTSRVPAQRSPGVRS
jgi:hypothetical protein